MSKIKESKLSEVLAKVIEYSDGLLRKKGLDKAMASRACVFMGVQPAIIYERRED